MRYAPPWRAVSALALAAAACLLLYASSARAPRYLDQLTKLVARTGTRIAPRLSISPPSNSATDTAPSHELLVLTGRIHAAVAEGTNPQAMHAAGLVTLMWTDSSNLAMADSVITYLHSTLRLTGPGAPILADLAAAHLVRAERPGAERHLLLALNAADSALAHDPANSTARFNRALALDRLSLTKEAAQAWRHFLALESGTEWSARAAQRLRAIEAVPGPLPRPTAGSPNAWRRLGEHEPQRARMLVMDTILPEWGRAVLDGNAQTARERLASAVAVAEGLARRRGDASVPDMVDAIRRAGPTTTRNLASAHTRYGRAQALLDRREAEAAEAEFSQVWREARLSPPLREWAEFSGAVAVYYQGEPDSALAAFRAIVERHRSGRYPTLEARARWSAGSVLLRTGNYPEASREYATAAEIFERTGEHEYLGGIRYLQFETQFSRGETDAAFVSMSEALRILTRYRNSRYLHNLLYVVAESSRVEGMSHTARALEDIDVQVAKQISPAVHAEALLVRARARAVAGETRAAAADATVARRLVQALPSGFQRAWLERDLVLANAHVQAWTDPARAAAAFDYAVDFYSERRVTTRLLPALVQRANTHLRAGNTAGAVADLERAASVFPALDSSVESIGLRAQMLEAGREVYDRLAMVHARAGHTAEALRALERSRASYSPLAGRARASAPIDLVAPRGETVLEYALIGDTLLAFTLSGTTLEMDVLPVRAEALAREVAALRGALESGAAERAVRPALRRLYRVLVKPVRSRIPRGAPLVVIADGELAGIPFAALVTSRRGGYLVQDHPLRFASTLRQAHHTAAVADGPRRPAVFVADPEVAPADSVAFPRLPRLAGATREIARQHPGSVLLEDAAAHTAGVRAAIKGASVFHFSGHAVFDNDRPDRSYLVLAPDSAGPGRLTADEVAGMELEGVRLVVLAACETQASVSGRSGGFAGLSGAMLFAGANGVMGSLWKVRERPSSELMSAFYRAYMLSGDGPGALRRAQLGMIDSVDPTLRSPSGWAGFRFAGH